MPKNTTYHRPHFEEKLMALRELIKADEAESLAKLRKDIERMMTKHKLLMDRKFNRIFNRNRIRSNHI